MNDFAAVILAAGLSSRMGEFKPMLKLGGRTMISRVVHLMNNAGAQTVVVTGHRAGEIENHLAGENVRFARNENFASTQMLDSLLIGLSRIPPECRRVFITPADIPLVREETIRRLLDSGGQFVRPAYQGKNGHPALMSCSLTGIFRSYTGNEGIRGAVNDAGIEITTVETDDFGVLLDADTPENYAELCRYYEDNFAREENR